MMTFLAIIGAVFLICCIPVVLFVAMNWGMHLIDKFWKVAP